MQKIIHGDCLEVLRRATPNSIDAIITDPPYELGFMGKSWDSTGIANNVELWKECLRVLKPGGHLLAFSGTRTYHRMACAIEDAGFEIRDMIEWVYGSGFPKSLNIGKAVDKLQGNERQDLGESDNNRDRSTHEYNSVGNVGSNARITKGTSEWEGYGTALKPAHEPICMARKPIECKTVAENCLKYGTGGINIDESRVATEDKMSYSSSEKQGVTQFGTGTTEQSPLGRFPSNLIHDGSDEVKECFPETKSVKSARGGNKTTDETNAIRFGSSELSNYECGFNDSGNASRFFKSIIYTAKASKSERNKGCEGLETKQTQGGGGGIGDYQNDVNSMSGKYGSEKAPAKNNHPTVKPIALMEYLIKMVTREGQNVLDPFAGSGSTLVACKNLNRGYVGIEMEEEYIKIINARLGNTL